MKADHRGDAEIAAGRGRLLEIFAEDLDLGQRLVPSPHVEEQLAKRAVRLSQPNHGADLVCQLTCLGRRREGLLVPIEVAQRDGLVDLEEQPQVRQLRIGLRDCHARSNNGRASVICPWTAVTMVSTCSAQPMAQLSPASDAAVSALAATRPAFSTSPRLL